MGCFISFLFPHLSAHFKLLHVTMVFFFFLFFWNFSPPAFKLKIKSINQRQWKKDVETEGHLNPFRVPKASEGEINRKLKWSREWQQSFFLGGLQAGAFLNASCFRFWSNGNESSSRLLICLRKKYPVLEKLKNLSLCCCVMSHGCCAKNYSFSNFKCFKLFLLVVISNSLQPPLLTLPWIQQRYWQVFRTLFSGIELHNYRNINKDKNSTNSLGYSYWNAKIKIVIFSFSCNVFQC